MNYTQNLQVIFVVFPGFFHCFYHCSLVLIDPNNWQTEGNISQLSVSYLLNSWKNFASSAKSYLRKIPNLWAELNDKAAHMMRIC